MYNYLLEFRNFVCTNDEFDYLLGKPINDVISNEFSELLIVFSLKKNLVQSTNLKYLYNMHVKRKHYNIYCMSIK